MVFILLGNIARSLKFELISHKIGLVFFRNGTWYTWTVSLPSLWLQLPWWQIVRCFKSGLHCTSLYIAFKALNLLEVSEVFWSFICIFKSNLYVHNHVSQKAKGEISNRDAIPNRETAIQVQAMFPTKNTLTIDTDDQKFNCDNANGHSQTGNRKKKYRQVEFKRQAIRTKAIRSASRLCLHTVDRTFIYANFLLLWIWQM